MVKLVYCTSWRVHPILIWIILLHNLSVTLSYSSPSSSSSLSYPTSSSSIGEAKVDIEIFHANRLILTKTMNIPLTKDIPLIHYRTRRDANNVNDKNNKKEARHLNNFFVKNRKKMKSNRKRLSQRNISAYGGARRPGRVGTSSLSNGKVVDDYNMRNRGSRGAPSTSTINYVYSGILIHVVRTTKSVNPPTKSTNTSLNNTSAPSNNTKNDSSYFNYENLYHDGCISKSSPLLNDINQLLEDNHNKNWIALVQKSNMRNSPQSCENPEVQLFNKVKPPPTVVIMYGNPSISFKQTLHPRGSSRRIYTGSSSPFNKKRIDSNSWTGGNRQMYREASNAFDSNMPNLHIREDASKDSQVILSLPWGDSKQILEKCRHSTGPLISNQKRSSKLRSNQNWLPINNNPKLQYEVCRININIQSSSDENFLNKTSVLFVSVSFILLMVISLAWLMFYYVQRFRYIHTKEQFSRRLANMAKKAVAKIPVKTLKPGDKETDPELDNCAICIEHYNPSDTVRILPCKHYFHKSCIDPWLLEQRSCPMCKLNILQAYGFLTTTTSSSNSTNSGNGLPTNSVSIVNDNGAIGVSGSIMPALSVSNLSTTNNGSTNFNNKNNSDSHVDDEQISEIFLATTPTNVADQSPRVLTALATQHNSIKNINKQPIHHQYSVGNLQNNYPTVAMVACQASGSHGDIGCYDSNNAMATKITPNQQRYSLLFSNNQQPERYNTVAMVSSLPGDVDADDCHGYKDSTSSPNHNEASVRLLSSVHGNTSTINTNDNTNNKSNSLRHLALYHRGASSSSSSSNTSLDHTVNQSNSTTNQKFCLPHSSNKLENSKKPFRCHTNRSSMGIVERPTSLYSLPGTLHKVSSIKSMIVVKETDNSMVAKAPSFTETIMSSFKRKQNNNNSISNNR